MTVINDLLNSRWKTSLRLLLTPLRGDIFIEKYKEFVPLWYFNALALMDPIYLQRVNFFLLCPTDVGSVEGLAYHRGWDTLYWTSYTTSTITRHTVDQSRSVAYNRNTVVTMSGEDHPRAFVLDECQEWVINIESWCASLNQGPRPIFFLFFVLPLNSRFILLQSTITFLPRHFRGSRCTS